MEVASSPQAVQPNPPTSPYSFPVQPSPGPPSPEKPSSELAASIENTTSNSNAAAEDPGLGRPQSLRSPFDSDFDTPIDEPDPLVASQASKRVHFPAVLAEPSVSMSMDSPHAGIPSPNEAEILSEDAEVDANTSNGNYSPPVPPKLKTALSKQSAFDADVGGGPRLTSAKRTVSWADLTNTGASLATVKEYQPEYPPASPLSDSSWDAESRDRGCACSIM